jgi:hypothetical protein
MENEDIGLWVRRLYTLATVNVGIWVLSLIALVVLLEGDGNLRGCMSFSEEGPQWPSSCCP